MDDNHGLRKGRNTADGELNYQAVVDSFDFDYLQAAAMADKITADR